MTFRDVIALWPTMPDLAGELGVSHGAVKQWRRRNSIPGIYWSRLVRAAELRGFPDVTLPRLADLAEES